MVSRPCGCRTPPPPWPDSDGQGQEKSGDFLDQEVLNLVVASCLGLDLQPPQIISTSCLLCFGAGVLLSTSLLHMLPEVQVVVIVIVLVRIIVLVKIIVLVNIIVLVKIILVVNINVLLATSLLHNVMLPEVLVVFIIVINIIGDININVVVIKSYKFPPPNSCRHSSTLRSPGPRGPCSGSREPGD